MLYNHADPNIIFTEFLLTIPFEIAGIIFLIIALLCLHVYHLVIRRRIVRVKDQLAEIELNPEAFRLSLRMQQRVLSQTSVVHEIYEDSTEVSVHSEVGEDDLDQLVPEVEQNEESGFSLRMQQRVLSQTSVLNEIAQEESTGDSVHTEVLAVQFDQLVEVEQNEAYGLIEHDSSSRMQQRVSSQTSVVQEDSTEASVHSEEELDQLVGVEQNEAYGLIEYDLSSRMQQRVPSQEDSIDSSVHSEVELDQLVGVEQNEAYGLIEYDSSSGMQQGMPSQISVVQEDSRETSVHSEVELDQFVGVEQNEAYGLIEYDSTSRMQQRVSSQTSVRQEDSTEASVHSEEELDQFVGVEQNEAYGLIEYDSSSRMQQRVPFQEDSTDSSVHSEVELDQLVGVEQNEAYGLIDYDSTSRMQQRVSSQTNMTYELVQTDLFDDGVHSKVMEDVYENIDFLPKNPANENISTEPNESYAIVTHYQSSTVNSETTCITDPIYEIIPDLSYNNIKKHNSYLMVIFLLKFADIFAAEVC